MTQSPGVVSEITRQNAVSCAHLFTMQAKLNLSLDSGEGPQGRRVLNSIAVGAFDGPQLRGDLIGGTGDWMLTRRDSVMVVDARVVLKTHDNAIIHMSYGGRIVMTPEILSQARNPEKWHLIDPAAYYFRTTPTFETGAQDYAWLNNVVCIGVGRLTQDRGIAYEIFQVL